jgi:hypothetical protein
MDHPKRSLTVDFFERFVHEDFCFCQFRLLGRSRFDNFFNYGLFFYLRGRWGRGFFDLFSA